MLKKIFFRWIICIAFFSVIIIGCTNRAQETPTAAPVSLLDLGETIAEKTPPEEKVQTTETPIYEKPSGPLATAYAQASGVDFATSSPSTDIPPGFEAWVQSRSYEIQSLTSDDFTDLQFLEPILEGNRIVQLGEDDHWTKEQSLMKVRLIQYLHQELGYEVIAFESNLLDCYLTNRHLETLSPQEAIGSLHWPFRTESVLPLFEYLAFQTESASPLMLAGFDIQTGFIENSPEFFYDLLIEYDAEFARKIWKLESTYLKFPSTYSKNDLDAAVSEFSDFHDSIEIYDHLALYLADNAEGIKKAYSGNPNNVDVARQTAWSKARFLEQTDSETRSWEGSNIRDYGMAQNVIFLAEELYPDKKIILWAHNRHSSEYIHSQHWKNMGVYLADYFGDSLYTIGLFGYRPPTIGEGLVDLLHLYGSPYLLLELEKPDTSGENRFQPRLPNYQYSPEVYYDGLIFLDKITYHKYLPANE